MKQFFKIHELNEEESIGLICFPCAGNGASTFWNWQKYLPNWVGVYPVYLTGREERIMEKPYVNLMRLANDIAKEIVVFFDTPIVLFGHSMGGKIAYEVAKQMKKKYLIEVCHLIVSGTRAPNIAEKHPIYWLEDNEFVKELERFGGTPKEILTNKELISFFTPLLRADFIMDETYLDHEFYDVKCPITAFGGQNDCEVEIEELRAWSKYTTNKFFINMFTGSHFFIRTNMKEVLIKILDILEKENRK